MPSSSRLALFVLIAALVALAVVIGPPLRDMLDAAGRGKETPQLVVREYVESVRRGDEGEVARLMPIHREQRERIRERIAWYGRFAGQELEIDYIPHAIASYLMTVRISIRGAVVDEVILEQSNDRWYLTLPPRPGVSVPVAGPHVRAAGWVPQFRVDTVSSETFDSSAR